MVTLNERETAVARAVALAFLHYNDSALSPVEIARIVAPDDIRDEGLQQQLTAEFRAALDEAVNDKEDRAREHAWERSSER